MPFPAPSAGKPRHHPPPPAPSARSVADKQGNVPIQPAAAPWILTDRANPEEGMWHHEHKRIHVCSLPIEYGYHIKSRIRLGRTGEIVALSSDVFPRGLVAERARMCGQYYLGIPLDTKDA